EAAALLDRMLRGAPAPSLPMLVQPQQAVARHSTDTLAIADAAVGAALRMIRARAHEGLHVDTLARELGLSRSVLQRRFRASLRPSVHQEILLSKIKRARELLVKTDLPLQSVAERAGFKHQEYMGAVLKERLGQTPGQLRMLHQT